MAFNIEQALFYSEVPSYHTQRFYRGGSMTTLQKDISMGFRSIPLNSGVFQDQPDKFMWVTEEVKLALVAAVARSVITQTPPFIYTFLLSNEILNKTRETIYAITRSQIERRNLNFLPVCAIHMNLSSNDGFVMSGVPVSCPESQTQIYIGDHVVQLPNTVVFDPRSEHTGAVAIYNQIYLSMTGRYLSNIVGEMQLTDFRNCC